MTDTQQYLFIAYSIVLLTSTAIGIVNFKKLSKPIHILIVLLCLTSVSELTTFIMALLKMYALRTSIYHFITIVEIVLIVRYFQLLLYPDKNNRLLLIGSIFTWVTLGTLNTVLLQPLNNLNSNMMMLESFIVITLSLSSIYWLLKQGNSQKIFYSPYLWISIILLVFWSFTFFFWAFIKILNGRNWVHVNILFNIHIIVNILVYTGLAIVLYLYPKHITNGNS